MLCPKRPCLLPCLFAVAFLPWTVPSLADPAPSGTGQAQAGTGQAGIPLAAQALGEKSQQRVTSTITPLAGHGGPLIHVHFNGSSEAATFIVDTGSSGSLISQALADKLGLKASPWLSPDGKPQKPFGKPIDAVPIDAFLIDGPPEQGPWRFKALGGDQFGVATPEELALSVDGYLGMEGLSHGALLFDFAGGRMDVMFPGGLSPDQVLSYGFGCVSLPLSPDKGSPATFSISVVLGSGTKSTRADLIVDTGSQVTVIPREAAKALGLNSLGEQPLAGGTAGYMQANQAQLSSLSLGDIRLTDVSVIYPGKKDHPALLGMDILKNYRVLLDFPGRMMYLQPPIPGFSMPRPDNALTPAPAPSAAPPAGP